MNSRHILSVLLTVASIASLSSCKDDDDETKDYLDNYPYFTIDAFVGVGDEYTLVPDEVTNDDGVEVGYYWTITSLMTTADTSEFEDGHITYKFDKDTTGTFTISCVAFAEGYYTASATATVTLVKPGLEDGSITGIIPRPDETYFDDDRDDQPTGNITYLSTPIGKQIWMKQNLAYTTKTTPIGLPYYDCEAMSGVFGRYYSWEEAQTVCPSGWHLPTEAEWLEAETAATGKTFDVDQTWEGISGDYMVYAKFNDESFWEYWPDVKVTNKTRISALATGWCNLETATFKGATTSAVFWTADEYDADNGVYRYIVVDKPDVYRGAGNKKSFGASVRCVAN